MFEACIRITEKDMTWSELKAFVEEKKLQIIILALRDSEGRMMFESSMPIPPDARCALHFKSAELDMASQETEIVSESVGYIDAESREITRKWDCKTGIITPKVSVIPENEVHGIRNGGI